jgi:hypothetical protein
VNFTSPFPASSEFEQPKNKEKGMKERTLVGGLAVCLVIAGLSAAKSADAIFIAATVGFFLLCIAYAEGCGRL